MGRTPGNHGRTGKNNARKQRLGRPSPGQHFRPRDAGGGSGARLSSEFQKLFSEPKFVEFLEKQAVVPAATDQAGFVAFLQEDKKAAETLIRIANTPKTEFKE